MTEARPVSVACASSVARPLLERYSDEHPLMILTDYPPDFGGGGAVIINSILTAEDRRRLIWLTTGPAATRVRADGLRVVSLERAIEWLPQSFRSSIWLNSTLLAHRLANEVLATAGAHQAKGLWSVLNNAIVPITAAVVRSRGIPVHCTVHDDPTFATALRSRRYPLLAPWIEHSLRTALRGCRSVDVISEAMARRYRDRFRVGPVVVHRAMETTVAPSPPYDVARYGLRVGVLGNTYGSAQPRALVDAVGRAAIHLGVKGTVTFIGGGDGVGLRTDAGTTIETLGHLDEARAIEVLRGCYLQYVNYPFSLRGRVFRQTSFPTKISTYLQSARPLLLHMPSDSSALSVKRFEPLALHWQSMNPSEGSRLLIKAWGTDALTKSVHCAAEAAVRAFYDGGAHRSTLARALNALVS